MVKPVEEKSSKDSPSAANRSWKPIGGSIVTGRFTPAVTLPPTPPTPEIVKTAEKAIPASPDSGPIAN